MYVDLRERRDRRSESIEQSISPDERTQLHNLVSRHQGTVLESVTRKLVATFNQADAALECARGLRTTVKKLRNPPWGGAGFFSRILLAPAPLGELDPHRWAELAVKMSIHLDGARPDAIIGLESFLNQLQQQPQPPPRPLRTAKGVSSMLFALSENNQNDDEETVTRAASSFSGAGIGMFSELTLKVGEKVRIVTPPDCPLSVGRSKTCAIMLAGDDVSRVHGRIEFIHEKYFYVDDSRNGTFVLTHDGNEVRLEKERLLLVGDGVISPGVPLLKQKGQVIRFRCSAVKLGMGEDTPTKPR